MPLKQYVLVCVALPWCTVGAFAFLNNGNAALRDSTTTPRDTVYALPEVLVEDERASNVQTRTLAPVTTLPQESIRQTGARQVGEALSYIPGVFIKNYGGLGGLKTMSLRGTSAAQTTVLLDGVRINSSQNGVVDLSAFPVGMVEAIDVVRGGESALFGASALGGVVNIRTVAARRVPQLFAYSHCGSFGTLGVGGSARFLVDSAVVLIGAEHQLSDGDYPFPFNEFGSTRTVRRANGDFRNTTGLIGIGSDVAGGQWHLHVLGRSTERGTPGAVVQGSIEEEKARLAERDVLAIVRTAYTLSPTVTLHATASGKYNSFRYRDANAAVYGANGIDETFTARDASAAVRTHIVEWGQVHELQVETGYAELRGKMLQPEVGQFVQRKTASLSGRVERIVQWDDGNSLIVQGALRVDSHSDAGTAVSPVLACSWHTAHIPVVLRAHWGYNFRPPSFNELYYLNFGTAGLRPERSHSLTIGAQWQATSSVSADAHAFLIDTRDKIVALPISPATWSARTIPGVQTRGIELAVRCALADTLLHCTAAYTLQTSVNRTNNSATRGKELPYVPQSVVAAMASARVLGADVGMQVQYTGARYSLEGESPNALLPAFVTVASSLSFSFVVEGIHLRAHARCDNIFNEDYSVIRNYPMPGRMWQAGVEVRY